MQNHDKNQVEDGEFISLIALNWINTNSSIKVRRLLELQGSARQTLMQIETIMARQVLDFNKRKLPKISELMAFSKAEIKAAKSKGIRITTFFDKNYPFRLMECPDAPLVLFSKGQFPLEAQRVLAIVGTRMSSEYGESVCKELIRSLKGTNTLIISGIALGIDGIAHRTALECGLKTIAVLGHGLDRLHPQSHRKLAHEIVSNGALLTEFSTGSSYFAGSFPSRNRIIAGISDAVVVIESGEKGGSLITARLANSYNRDVFAVPGRIGDPMSKGCLNLIKNHSAALIEGGEDLMRFMGWENRTNSATGSVQTSMFTSLDENEKSLVEYIGLKKECHIDQLALHTNLTISELASTLLTLEFKDILTSIPGRIYRLKA
ncbi:MAG: DNA-processing protein DprA [Vicingaceae bacterium]